MTYCAVCTFKWELADAILLVVMHLRSLGQSANNSPPSCVLARCIRFKHRFSTRHFTRQKSSTDSSAATGLLYKGRQKHISVCWAVLNKRLAVQPPFAEQKQSADPALQPVVQNSSDNGSAGIDRRRYGSGSINEGTTNDLAEGLRSSAKLGAVSSQTPGALKSDSGDSAQPSDQPHTIVADAVKQTAKAKKAFSKSGSV
jgi:hypothetical protein